MAANYYCTKKFGKIYISKKKESTNVSQEAPSQIHFFDEDLPKEYISGPSGTDGRDGADGRDGIDGKDGRDGRDGIDGRDGLLGRDGVDGKDGRDGINGNPCERLILGDDILSLTSDKEIRTTCSTLVSEEPFKIYKNLSVGAYNNTSEHGAVAFGLNNSSSGVASLCTGYANEGTAFSSFCSGIGNFAYSSASLTSGVYLHNHSPGTLLCGTSSHSLPYPYSLQLGGGLDGNEGVGLILRTEKRGTYAESIGVADAWMSNAWGYGEMFEASEHIPYGTFVTLKGGKLVVADKEAIGVVVPRLAVVGNAGELHWSKANLQGDFGEYSTTGAHIGLLQLFLQLNIQVNVIDDIENIAVSALDQAKKNISVLDEGTLLLHCKILHCNQEKYLEVLERKIRSSVEHEIILVNEEEIKDCKYIPRSRRKEWRRVCLKGTARVLHRGLLPDNDRCDVENGIAVAGSKYIVVSVQSDNVATVIL